MDEVPQLFTHFVNSHRKKFPMVVQVQEGIYGDQVLDSEVQDFSCGDYLILEKIVDEVNVTFENFYDQPSHQGQITLPAEYDGNLEVLSRFPLGHVFPTAADVMKDCVTYVYPQLQIEAQNGIAVNPGDRLRVLKKVTLPKGDYILCMLVREDRNVMIPLETLGKFEKREEFPECRLKDIIDRLPQRVRIVKDESMMVRGIGHMIEGLPEDYFGDILLSRVEFVQAHLWDSPDKRLKIPCSININVMAKPEMESKFGDVCDIHTLVERDVLRTTTKVVIADDEQRAEQLGITMDTIFRIQDHKREICVLVESAGSFLLLPLNFEGKFESICEEFKTAIDLFESGYKEEVRVTHAHISADPRDDSLYTNDKVKIHANNLLVVPKIPRSSYEEHELVLLDRHFSTQGHVGLVKVPTYAFGRFRTSEDRDEELPLTKVLESPLPQTVGFLGFPKSNKKAPTTEYHLKEGKSVKVHGAHAFNVVYVIPDDTNNNPDERIRVIPDFVPLKVRPLRPDLPNSKGKKAKEGKVNVNPLEMSVIKLEKEQFEDIMSKIEADRDPSTGVYVEAVIEGNTDRKLPALPPDEGHYDRLSESAKTKSTTLVHGRKASKSMPAASGGYEKVQDRKVIPQPSYVTDVPPPIISPSPGARGGSHSAPSSPREYHPLASETSQRTLAHDSSSPQSPTHTQKKTFSRLRKSVTLPRMPFHFKHGTLRRNKKRSKSESGIDT